MVDIFDKSKHASFGDSPAAGDGSCFQGFLQPKEWLQFTVKYIIQILLRYLIKWLDSPVSGTAMVVTVMTDR